jgi:hypothetical protein
VEIELSPLQGGSFRERILEPSHLPVELFAMVIDYATDGKKNLASLCNFSLVSRPVARLPER